MYNGGPMALIRNMTAGDIPTGLELCRLAGWNQLEADWQRLLALAPRGMFVAQEDGKVCGTASAVSYPGREISTGKTASEDAVAWIGMILVHLDFRGRGIGSALMQRCIEHLRAESVSTIKLDATDQGRPVYVKLGFVDEQQIWRMTNSRDQKAGTRDLGPGNDQQFPLPVDEFDVCLLQPHDWRGIAALDLPAFGADRLDLLMWLSAEGPAMVARRERGGEIVAFGMARPGQNAWQLGPIVAADTSSGRAVAEAMLSVMPQEEIFWDLLPDNREVLAMAEQLGFSAARRLLRMRLGPAIFEHPERIVAAAGFELG